MLARKRAGNLPAPYSREVEMGPDPNRIAFHQAQRNTTKA